MAVIAGRASGCASDCDSAEPDQCDTTTGVRYASLCDAACDLGADGTGHLIPCASLNCDSPPAELCRGLSLCNEPDPAVATAFRSVCPAQCGLCGPAVTAAATTTAAATKTTMTPASCNGKLDPFECVQLPADACSHPVLGSSTRASCPGMCGECSGGTAKPPLPSPPPSNCGGGVVPSTCDVDPALCNLPVVGDAIRIECPSLCGDCTPLSTVPPTSTIPTTATSAKSTSPTCNGNADAAECDDLVDFCFLPSVSRACPSLCGTCNQPSTDPPPTTGAVCNGIADPVACQQFSADLCFSPTSLGELVLSSCPATCGLCVKTTTQSTQTNTYTKTTTTPVCNGAIDPSFCDATDPQTCFGSTFVSQTVRVSCPVLCNTCIPTTKTDTTRTITTVTSTSTLSTTTQLCNGVPDPQLLCADVTAESCFLDFAVLFACPVTCNFCISSTSTTSVSTVTERLCNGVPDPVLACPGSPAACDAPSIREFCPALCGTCVPTTSVTTKSSTTVSTETISTTTMSTTTITKSTTTVTETTTQTTATRTSVTKTTLSTTTLPACNGVTDNEACSAISPTICLLFVSAQMLCPASCGTCVTTSTTMTTTTAPALPTTCGGKKDPEGCSAVGKSLCFSIPIVALSCPVMCGTCLVGPETMTTTTVTTVTVTTKTRTTTTTKLCHGVSDPEILCAGEFEQCNSLVLPIAEFFQTNCPVLCDTCPATRTTRTSSVTTTTTTPVCNGVPDRPECDALAKFCFLVPQLRHECPLTCNSCTSTTTSVSTTTRSSTTVSTTSASTITTTHTTTTATTKTESSVTATSITMTTTSLTGTTTSRTSVTTTSTSMTSTVSTISATTTTATTSTLTETTITMTTATMTTTTVTTISTVTTTISQTSITRTVSSTTSTISSITISTTTKLCNGKLDNLEVCSMFENTTLCANPIVFDIAVEFCPILCNLCPTSSTTSITTSLSTTTITGTTTTNTATTTTDSTVTVSTTSVSKTTSTVTTTTEPGVDRDDVLADVLSDTSPPATCASIRGTGLCSNILIGYICPISCETSYEAKDYLVDQPSVLSLGLGRPCDVHDYYSCTAQLAVALACPVTCAAAVSTTTSDTTTVTATTTRSSTTATATTTSMTDTTTTELCNGQLDPELCKGFSNAVCSQDAVGQIFRTQCPALCDTCKATTPAPTTKSVALCNGQPDDATICDDQPATLCGNILVGAGFKESCPLLCNACEATAAPSETSLPIAACYGVADPTECIELATLCNGSSELSTLVLEKCPATCNACPITTPDPCASDAANESALCIDLINDCGLPEVAAQCPHACGACTTTVSVMTTAPCFDVNDNCATLLETVPGFCDAAIAQTNCPASCGTCA